MPIPLWKWSLTTPQPVEASSVPSMLRQWHSANRLGLEIRQLLIDDKETEPHTLQLLNIWIGCGGAFNASRQDYFEAWRRLERVLKSPYKAQKPPRSKADRANL